MAYPSDVDLGWALRLGAVTSANLDRYRYKHNWGAHDSATSSPVRAKI